MKGGEEMGEDRGRQEVECDEKGREEKRRKEKSRSEKRRDGMEGVAYTY